MGRCVGLYLDGEKTRELLFNSGKTKDDLAAELGCTRGYVNCLLNSNYLDVHTVGLNTATRIAKAFGKSVNDIRKDGLTTKPKPICKHTRTNSDYGELIEDWLEYKDISQNTLQRRAGLEKDTVRKIKNGYTLRPRRATLELIAGAFGVTYEEFMAGVPGKISERKLEETDTEDTTAKETQESVKDEFIRNIPVWLYAILEEEILDAHKGFSESTKAADKKCYASIVEMHSRLFVKGNTEQ